MYLHIELKWKCSLISTLFLWPSESITRQYGTHDTINCIYNFLCVNYLYTIYTRMFSSVWRWLRAWHIKGIKSDNSEEINVWKGQCEFYCAWKWKISSPNVCYYLILFLYVYKCVVWGIPRKRINRKIKEKPWLQCNCFELFYIIHLMKTVMEIHDIRFSTPVHTYITYILWS